MVLLFHEIAFTNFIVALLAKLFFVDVHYYRISSGLLPYVSILKTLGINGVSFENIEDALIKLNSRTPVMGEYIFSKYIADHPYLNTLIDFFNLDSKKEKFKYAIKSTVRTSSMEFAELTIFAEYLSEQNTNAKIYLWSDPSFIHLKSIEALKGSYRILTPKFLYIIKSSYRFLNFIFKKIIKKLIHSSQLKSISISEKNTINNGPRKVVFFPHQGIFYSDLFLKDHYYFSELTSPFHKTNILHLSVEDPASIMVSSHKYYQKESMPHADISHFRTVSAKKMYRDLLKVLFQKKEHFFYKIFSNGLEPLKILFSSSQLFYYFLSCVDGLKGTKIALLGFEALFPPLLSVALSHRNILVVSTQERFLLAWYESYLPLLDTYFASGAAAIERLKKTHAPIDTMIPLGLVRTDTILEYVKSDKENKYSKIKETHKILLALDYHARPDANSNRLAVCNNWKTIKNFHQDMIALAKKFSSLYIIIKCKDYSFTKLPAFKDVVAEIESLPNITVETDHANYPPARMAALSDGAIALHTSLGDEMLAAGKPVIFYDMCGTPTPFFNYEGLVPIVKNQKDLIPVIEKFIKTGELISKENFKLMDERFYNHSQDGLTHERLHNQMHKIINSLI